MDAYKILEKEINPESIDENYFTGLKARFRSDYLASKNYYERIDLHRNPNAVKSEVLNELYEYLKRIDTREELRDIDLEKNATGYVSSKVKEIWEADKRLNTDLDAIKKYCINKPAPLNIIAVHLAELFSLRELAADLNKELYLTESEPPVPASVWDVNKTEKLLRAAFENNSELELLEVLKTNSFLFHELYERKFAIQPVFHEINFGAKLRADFAWLNDNSDGPEWVLVEVEKPRMKLFSKNHKPSSELSYAIEQVKSWDRYFKEYPSEKKRIFGAVARFRFILVAGDHESWSSEQAIKWRAHHNAESNIEIRSSTVFTTALDMIKSYPANFWSFEENPVSIPFSALEKYWQTYGYMDSWRKIF